MKRSMIKNLVAFSLLLLGCNTAADVPPLTITADDSGPGPIPVDSSPAGPQQDGITAVASKLAASGMSDVMLQTLLDRVQVLAAVPKPAGLVGTPTSNETAKEVGTWFLSALGGLEGAELGHIISVVEALTPTAPQAQRIEALQLLVGRSLSFWSTAPERANPLMNALTAMLGDLGYDSIVLFPDPDATPYLPVGPRPILEILRVTTPGGGTSSGSDAGVGGYDAGSGSGGYDPGSGSGSPYDGGVGSDGGSRGCGAVMPVSTPDPWCAEHKDDLANATINCISGAVCGLLADKLGGSVAANLAADGICDDIANKIKTGIGVENMELGAPYFQDAPKKLTAIFPPIDLAQKLVSCGINLPAALLTAGFSHLYCFNYTSTHGQPVQYTPCPPPQQPSGNAICSRASSDDPSCSAGSSGQSCDGGGGRCSLGVAGSGCRCVH